VSPPPVLDSCLADLFARSGPAPETLNVPLPGVVVSAVPVARC